jgi:hypothetical protein
VCTSSIDRRLLADTLLLPWPLVNWPTMCSGSQRNAVRTLNAVSSAISALPADRTVCLPARCGKSPLYRCTQSILGRRPLWDIPVVFLRLHRCRGGILWSVATALSPVTLCDLRQKHFKTYVQQLILHGTTSWGFSITYGTQFRHTRYMNLSECTTTIRGHMSSNSDYKKREVEL